MKYTPKLIAENGLTFTIPLYQRLFEWNNGNVTQLLDDLNNAFLINSESDYFIGMLTATDNKEKDNHYQLIDGQQRFTVMTLLGCALKKYCNEWNLFLKFEERPRLIFVSRKSDNEYLSQIVSGNTMSDDNIFINKKMKSGIDCITQYMNKYENNKKEDFAKYIYEHLCFFITKLPTHYSAQNLNTYFERMNSTGKNLAHHEILKVKLLSKLKGNVSLYMQLWNKIADVDTILIRQKENENNEYFFGRKKRILSSGLETITAESGLINGLKEGETSNCKKISEISSTNIKPKSSGKSSSGSRCPIKFPQLILLTLYYFCSTKEISISRIETFFDTSKLLETFSKYLPYEGENVNEGNLQAYFEMLIKCRVMMDTCFIRCLEYGYELDMNLPEDDKDVKTLMMFESFLYVSSTNVTNYRWFTWLADFVMQTREIPSPQYLFSNLKACCDKSNPLPAYDDLKFGAEIRYWFWRLDFCIWEQRKDLFNESVSDLKSIVENYVFIRNRSIEHIAPQHPKTESTFQWEKDTDDEDTKRKLSTLRNSFGNLVMISQGLNSALSNSSYLEKKAHVESYFNSVNGTIESLKLLMAYKDFKDDWNINAIETHGEEMYKLLDGEIGKITN